MDEITSVLGYVPIDPIDVVGNIGEDYVVTGVAHSQALLRNGDAD